MSCLHQPKEIGINNQDSWKTLMRAITRSQGDFSLILARCNSTQLRESLLQQFHDQCPVKVRVLVLDRSVKTLYTTILEEVGHEQPTALMVSSLESVNALDQLLIATNLVREEFRNFACPLVLWVTDEVLQKLIRLVPDFESWATSVEFSLAVAEAQYSAALQSVA
ncbi:hypothetical protein [Lyngbya aestuarii]|uniref:hypothetical protein n=1 Tax=Lyngbya aestuarii TaxID=118322 RepID=UPI00403D7076